MFQSFHLVVDLVPGHAEHFRQHSFDQMVANHRPLGDFPSLRGQADVPFFFDGDKPIFLQALQGERYAGLVTESQWARVAGITVCPSASASAMAFR
ncbi:MAG TPA: hypothetical protein VE377_06605 [Candidatus Dormibacteraeota bacterium]|nr:hypothetical protein [Candidatus Dormibacteraeota bacterium]